MRQSKKSLKINRNQNKSLIKNIYKVIIVVVAFFKRLFFHTEWNKIRLFNMNLGKPTA